MTKMCVWTMEERTGPDCLTDCRRIRLKLVSALLACAICMWANIAKGGPYSASKTRLSASGGAVAGGFALGIDVGYFIYEGVELSGGVTYLNTDSLDVLQITPAARYVLDLDGVDPYVGGFARHWSFLDTDDPSRWSAGLRGGIILRRGQLFLGVGVAREVVLDCPEYIEECTQVYPEINFAVHL